ncbi:MAG TPA: mannose-6-phosphate isomerase, class I [Dermatophilaceae bacterium]|nr:mannose-6-phosphate isomerase, class I [Dermatophilaceae bacterium]
MERLKPVVFHDAWGSFVSIASLQGRSIPSPEPESELWMGAHESGPSGVEGPGALTLADVIAADPEGELGGACVARSGPRLPFLLKVLAAGRALSIQAHPTAERARALRADSGGSDDVYVDDEAKPEMLVALAPFEVFVGLREPAVVAAIADRLRVPRFQLIVDAAGTAADPAHALLAEVLAVPAGERTAFVREVVRACVRLEASSDPVGHACAAVVRVAEDHPDDIGLAVLLLMQHRVLEPGEFLDVPPGVLHAYVRGLGIEVLANSDNVVRAGLTEKAVNVEELLRVVDSRAPGGAGRSDAIEDGVELFRSSSDRFQLHRLSASSPVALPGDGGPRIVFCLRGSAVLHGPADRLGLGRAESAFVPAREEGVTVSGPGEVYVVSCPLPAAP